MFLPLPVSTLYATITETWFENVFRFAVMINHLLLKILEFIFLGQYDLLTVLVWFLFQVMGGSISLTSADLATVVDLSTLHTPLPKGPALSGWMTGITIAATMLCRYRWVPLKPDFLGAWKSVQLKHYPAYPITIISLIMQRNLATKILPKRESGLTAVRLKRDPPVSCHMFVVFSDCVSAPLLLSLSCQIPLFHLTWLLWWTGLFGLPLSLPKIILVHLLQLYFPKLWWIL